MEAFNDGLEFLGLSGIVGWLIAGMKGLVCAVIYWMFYWVWPWFQFAMNLLPSSVTTAPATIIAAAADWYRLGNVFMPLNEALPILFAYWVFLLAFRLFHVVDQVKSI